MLVVSVPELAGSQPVELRIMFVCDDCTGLVGCELDGSHGGTLGRLLSCCRTVAGVHDVGCDDWAGCGLQGGHGRTLGCRRTDACVPDALVCAIDDVHGLLAIAVPHSVFWLPLMSLNS